LLSFFPAFRVASLKLGFGLAEAGLKNFPGVLKPLLEILPGGFTGLLYGSDFIFLIRLRRTRVKFPVRLGGLQYFPIDTPLLAAG